MSWSPTRREDPQKACILIVEDEPMLAFALEELLSDAGFEIAGVAGRIEAALTMIESGVFDAAIVDANLAGISAGPAASALRTRGLPFIVVSGYLPSQQQSAFAGARCLQKPFSPESVIQALRDLLPAQ
jgi:CheY-like chemotaxis protein